jgi:putative membrane-bound dehydrogenase-like protein
MIASAIIVLGALSPISAYAQISAEESARKLKPAEGLEASLWAAEPMLMNPTNMDVDSRGRVWITEGLNYRLTRNRDKKRQDDSDKIKILEDTDGDGKADKMTVFADKIFPVPMGLAVEEHYGKDGKYQGCKVYVGNSPDLLVLEDTDGDDKADKRYALLTGFGGIDSDHGVHGMTLALDGKLYFTHGDGCCSVQVDHSERTQNFNVLDKSGRRVSSSNLANTLRVNRDGTMFEILADRQRNNYETCLNAFGNNFTSDNDDDGNRGCRVIWVMDGGHYGYRTPGSPRHWGEDVPGNVPKIVGTGNGSPCGVTVYEGTLLPEKYQGMIFEAEAGTRQINAIEVERHGAAFRTRLGVLLSSDDPWFRPVDMTAAPDGSLFVADWYDAGVGGHAFRDQTTGRVFRVAPRGNKWARVHYDFGSIAGLIAALKSPVVATQDAARRGLIVWGKDAITPLRELFKTGRSIDRARALWVLHAIEGDSAAVAALHDHDPRIREQAVRILGRDVSRVGEIREEEFAGKTETAKNGENLGEISPRGDDGRFGSRRRFIQPRAGSHLRELAPLVDDPDAGVRRELILSLRDVPTQVDSVGSMLLKLTKNWDGRDRWYIEALGLALQKRESAFLQKIFHESFFGDLNLAAAGKESGLALPPYFPVDRNEAYIEIGAADPPVSPLSKTLGLMWRVHVHEVLPLLSSILPALESPDLRDAADDVLRRLDDPSGAKILARSAVETRDTARRNQLLSLLARKLDADWAQARGDEAIVATIKSALGDPSTRLMGIALTTGESRYLDDLARFAADARSSVELRVAAIDKIASIRVAESAEIVAGIVDAAQGKKVSTPEAEAALRALVRLKDSRARLLEIIQSDRYPTALRAEALRLSAQRRDDAIELIKLAREKKLPEALKTEATFVLNTHADATVREEAGKILPIESTVGRKLPPLEMLLRRRGDAARGEAVFLRANGTSQTGAGAIACASCHRVQGRGRWVGPDLSTIGVKYGKEELLRSIINPNAAIGYNFRTTVVATTDGRTISGILIEEAPDRLTLKKADGERVTIKTGEIDEKTTSDVSLMPQGLAQSMTDRELIDLLAYLSSLRKPVSIVGQFQVLGPIGEKNGVLSLDPKNTNISTNSRVKGSDGVESGRRRVVANAEGIVDATGSTADVPGDSQFVYLYAPVVSPLKQSVRLVIDVSSEARVWVDGRELKVAERSKADDPIAIEFDLAAGKNSLLIRLPAGPTAKLVATFVAATPIEFQER